MSNPHPRALASNIYHVITTPSGPKLEGVARFTGEPGQYRLWLPGADATTFRVSRRLRTAPEGILAFIYMVTGALGESIELAPGSIFGPGTPLEGRYECTNLLTTVQCTWNASDEVLLLETIEHVRVPIQTAPLATPTGGVHPERPMESKFKPMLKTLEVDATDAAWRMAGSQFTKIVRDPMAALLARHLSPDDDSLRARIAAFLDTELGTGLLSSLLSVGLSALPLPPNDVSQRLARELRIAGMAKAGDALADVLMGPLRQVAVMYLQGVPNAPDAPPQIDAARTVLDPRETVEAPVDAVARD